MSSRGLTLVLLAGCAALPADLHADPIAPATGLTPAEMRGMLIYTAGKSASGQPVAFRLISAGNDALPANGVYCLTCHGPEGKGGNEGPIVLADIRYATLTQPLLAGESRKRTRSRYTDELLGRAITEGFDASGQPLDGIMPRWVLSKSELEDLIQYMKRLGVDAPTATRLED